MTTTAGVGLGCSGTASKRVGRAQTLGPCFSHPTNRELDQKWGPYRTQTSQTTSLSAAPQCQPLGFCFCFCFFFPFATDIDTDVSMSLSASPKLCVSAVSVVAG